jgi:hypothetical protein
MQALQELILKCSQLSLLLLRDLEGGSREWAGRHQLLEASGPRLRKAGQALPLYRGDQEASCTWESSAHSQVEAREGAEEQQKGTGTSN